LLGSYQSFGFVIVVNADCYYDAGGRLQSIQVSKGCVDLP
jgi:hypothetical protein